MLILCGCDALAVMLLCFCYAVAMMLLCFCHAIAIVGGALLLLVAKSIQVKVRT